MRQNHALGIKVGKSQDNRPLLTQITWHQHIVFIVFHPGFYLKHHPITGATMAAIFWGGVQLKIEESWGKLLDVGDKWQVGIQ